MAKSIRVGHVAGAPGTDYLWSVCYLDLASKDAEDFLTKEQYAHAVDLMRTLATESNPRVPVALDVDKVEDFLELSDKGGILGKISLRLFFIVEDAQKAILVLGAIKKEADGKTPLWAKIRMRNRLRCFRNGEYGSLPLNGNNHRGK